MVEVKHVNNKNKTHVMQSNGATRWVDITNKKEFTRLAANDLLSVGHDVPGVNAPDKLYAVFKVLLVVSVAEHPGAAGADQNTGDDCPICALLPWNLA